MLVLASEGCSAATATDMQVRAGVERTHFDGARESSIWKLSHMRTPRTCLATRYSKRSAGDCDKITCDDFGRRYLREKCPAEGAPRACSGCAGGFGLARKTDVDTFIGPSIVAIARGGLAALKSGTFRPQCAAAHLQKESKAVAVVIYGLRTSVCRLWPGNPEVISNCRGIRTRTDQAT
jgi:hypothetical protein